MPYELVSAGTYPGTDLPAFKVFPTDDIRAPHIGEVWAVGVLGVTQQFIPIGVRYQLAGSHDESPLFDTGAFATAARAMIREFEGKGKTSPYRVS